MQKQSYFPRVKRSQDVVAIHSMDNPTGTHFAKGKDWIRWQAFRTDTFSLVTHESQCSDNDDVGYTLQGNYIKINFWLSGRHTTVLDGFGQHEHAHPEVFITSGPPETVKVDVMSRDSRTEVVALCLLPDFFTQQLGLASDQVPEPVRSLLIRHERPFAFNRFPLTPDLLAATRAVLSAPFAVRKQPLYAQAKAVELVSLLIHQLSAGKRRRSSLAAGQHEARLHAARQLILERYAQELTLDWLSREVGLNRFALTAGFRELFDSSVYDFLKKTRMDKAYELLRDETLSITKVAAAVGYSHACNFSTAFRSHFGCSPAATRVVDQGNLDT